MSWSAGIIRGVSLPIRSVPAEKFRAKNLQSASAYVINTIGLNGGRNGGSILPRLSTHEGTAMLGHVDARLSDRANCKLRTAMDALLEASEYAENTESTRWDFAVPIAQLREFDLNDSDLRWLVKKGFVDHSREVTVEGENGRLFKPTGDLTFCVRSCFILTDHGVLTARSRAASDTANHPDQDNSSTIKPCWFAEIRELKVEGSLVKRFKWQAVNQETVLSAFEEDGWPIVIDDPLPPKPNQDSKRRLHDTIKALNRNQNRIRFHGNGTGQGIRWELTYNKVCPQLQETDGCSSTIF